MGDLAPYQKLFERVAPSLPGAEFPWAKAARQAAFDQFYRTGFPTPKQEEWHFTSLASLAASSFDFDAEPGNGISEESLVQHLFDPPAVHRLVFVNGRFVSSQSQKGEIGPGIRLASLAELLEKGDADLQAFLAASGETEDFAALNHALSPDGVWLQLDPHARLEIPVHIIHRVSEAARGQILCPRLLISAGEGSVADVVESYLGPDELDYWTHATSDLRLAAGASLSHIRLQNEGTAATHMGQCRVSLDRETSYRHLSVNMGGRLTRHEAHLTLAGEDADCQLDGIYLAKGEQHHDQTTTLEHRAPHCRSRQLYKGVADEHARSVFQGAIEVHQAAQKTDAKMTNHNLLLSPEAEADSKPELEIFADDVKCAHGATVGELDREQLFYLKSRGIPAEQARAMLIEAFVNEVIDQAEPALARPLLREATHRWMQTLPACGRIGPDVDSGDEEEQIS